MYIQLSRRKLNNQRGPFQTPFLYTPSTLHLFDTSYNTNICLSLHFIIKIVRKFFSGF